MAKKKEVPGMKGSNIEAMTHPEAFTEKELKEKSKQDKGKV